MLEKTITVCGQEVRFRASATIPRLYRVKFKRDIFPLQTGVGLQQESYRGRILCY